MPRVSRIFAENACFHIITKGAKNKPFLRVSPAGDRSRIGNEMNVPWGPLGSWGPPLGSSGVLMCPLNPGYLTSPIRRGETSLVYLVLL